MEQTAPALDPAAAEQAAASQKQAPLRAMASGDLADAETALGHEAWNESDQPCS
jgi:hypothetical protein